MKRYEVMINLYLTFVKGIETGTKVGFIRQFLIYRSFIYWGKIDPNISFHPIL